MNKIITFLSLLLGLPLFGLAGVQNINNDSAIKQTSFAVVKFYRNGCPHCRAYEQPFASTAANFPNYKFMAVDTDANSALASQYSIRGVPTTIIFKDGKEVSRFTGNDAGKLKSSLSR